MLKIKLSGGPQLAEVLKNKPSWIVGVLTTKMTNLMAVLSQYVIGQKLSGTPLARRTGTLAASVHAVPTEITGTKIIGAVEAGAGPAGAYARVHEFGGTHAYEIVASKAKALHYVMDGRERWSKSVMRQPLAARPFMAPSLEELSPFIKEELQAALNQALKVK